MKERSIIVLTIFLIIFTNCEKKIIPPPEPVLPIPSAKQLNWQKKEMLMFVHFGIKTFYPSDNHMGEGNEDPNKFNPVKFNARQWVKAAKAGGFKGIVLTTKHHDGFCNWQTNTTDHSLKSSSWKDGKGDIVAELANACHDSGMLFGLYFSIWDRNYEVSGRDKSIYSDFYVAQLTELLINYGQVDELWFDGFGADNMLVDFKKVSEIIKEYQPKAIVYDSGTLVEFMQESCASWPGRHGGVKDPNWSFSEEYGNVWYPAEASAIAQGNWFYNNTPIISLDKLKSIYLSTVGLNAVALINVAPNQEGLIDESSIERLKEFKNWIDGLYENDLTKSDKVKISANSKRGDSDLYGPGNLIDDSYESYFTTDDSIENVIVEIDFGKLVYFRGIILQEYIPLGQRVASYSVECFNGTDWVTISEQKTIGYKKIIMRNSVETDGQKIPKSSKIRLVISESRGAPVINTFKVIG